MGDLGNFYWGWFIVCVLVAIGLQLYAQTQQSKKDASGPLNNSGHSARFNAFQRNYIIVYLLAMFADWLQGPYVYELYVSYGFDQAAIAELFVCGFGSSMIVGTFVGGMADKLGRKNMCILYSITYGKHSVPSLLSCPFCSCTIAILTSSSHYYYRYCLLHQASARVLDVNGRKVPQWSVHLLAIQCIRILDGV